MLQDMYWECRICEACGVCARTEEECNLYHEYYHMGEIQDVAEPLQQAITTTPQNVASNKGLMNWLPGQIIKVVEGDVMAQLTIKFGENHISSIMPVKEYQESGKKEGDFVTAVFKAVNVKIMHPFAR